MLYSTVRACLPGPRPTESCLPACLPACLPIPRLTGRPPVVHPSPRHPSIQPFNHSTTDTRTHRRRFQMPPLGSVETAPEPLPGQHLSLNQNTEQNNKRNENHSKNNGSLCQQIERLIRSPRNTRSTGPRQRRAGGGTSSVATKPTPATGRRTRALHPPETPWIRIRR